MTYALSLILLLLLAAPLAFAVSYLMLKRNWKPTRTLVVSVPYGVLSGTLLAWLMGLRGWDLLVGAFGGGMLSLISMGTRAKDIEAMNEREGTGASHGPPRVR
jgi:hypothetical protein